MDVGTTPFPASIPPEVADDAVDHPSAVNLRVAVPAVALAIADAATRARLGMLLARAGRLVASEDVVSVAPVILTDVPGGARAAITGLRARARSDAAIVVLFPNTTGPSEIAAAYASGALLCLREPIDEHELFAVVGSVVDTHAAKTRADSLARQLDLHAHLASLGRVTANLAHELGNPLAVMSINVDTLQREVCETEPARLAVLRDAIADTRTALDRASLIVAQLRSLSGASLGASVQDVPLATFAADVRRWAFADLQGIEVEELIDEPVIARADRRLLGQIAINLLANAAHAARQLPAPRIRIHVYGTPKTAILSVRDNGPGIPIELQDQIFEPFFTTRRGAGGTGLGLALCREYATQMGARITMWTAPGRGTCFRVHMPRSEQCEER